MSDPKNRNDEEDDQIVDTAAQEVAESLDGYQDYMREIRGNNLTFGDY